MDNIALTEVDKNKYMRLEYNNITYYISNSIDAELTFDEIVDLYDVLKNKKMFSFISAEEWRKIVKYVFDIRKEIINFDNSSIIEDKNNNRTKYSVPFNESSAWQIFKKGLLNSGKYSFREIEQLEKGTIHILNNLSNNKEDSPVKGLVMGYVQSGKTTSMEALISMAGSFEWNLFIVLSGTLENLRLQTLDRIKKDIDKCPGSIHWLFSPNFEEDKIDDIIRSGKKVVLVILKNSKRLENFYQWLFQASDASLNKTKVLLIDDEADQASLNTKKKNDEASKIYELIQKIINSASLRTGAMNYVGYTATPYGIFLNDYEGIYPKNFIYKLPCSNKYIGAQKIFGNKESNVDSEVDGLNIKRIFGSNDIGILYDAIQKKDYKLMPKSLKKAVCWFIDTLAIRRYNNYKKPVSMLIHIDRLTDVHFYLYQLLSFWFNNFENKKEIKELCYKIFKEETSKFGRENFCAVMSNYNYDIEDYPSYYDIKPFVNEIVDNKLEFLNMIPDNDGIIKYDFKKGLIAVIDNSKIKTNSTIEPRLYYPNDGQVEFATGHIIIGGDSLSRGLTLEGLTTSYFCRGASQVDTLMQMGRWFGYRVGYELLPRLWLDDSSCEKFKIMTDIEYDLRNNLDKYVVGENPATCAPLIKEVYFRGLKLTSPAKMNCKKVSRKMNYSGIKPQTIYFDSNIELQKQNYNATIEFIKKINLNFAYNNSSNLLAEKVDISSIKSFIKNFKFCYKNEFFNNIDAFFEWIELNSDDKFNYWNVIVDNPISNSAVISVDNLNIHKDVRSKLKGNANYINIGRLQRTANYYCDIEIPSTLKTEEEKLKYRMKNLTTPQLIIFIIDGNGKSSKIKNSDMREDLNFDGDIVGLQFNITGEYDVKKTQYVTLSIPASILNDIESKG